VGPLPFDSLLRKAQGLRALLDREAGIKPQLHQFSFLRVLGGQALQRFINEDERVRRGIFSDVQLGPVHVDLVASALFALFGASAIDEYVSHGLRAGAKEMLTIVPGRQRIAPEFEPSLMNKCCRLQRLSRSLFRDLCPSQLAKLVIDDWQQFVRRLRIALSDRLENARYVTDDAILQKRVKMVKHE